MATRTANRIDRPHEATLSTCVDVVAAGPSIVCVGTSTVTVKPGATLADVVADLAPLDGSTAQFQALGADGTPRDGHQVTTHGDRLVILAEDGATRGEYALAPDDPAAPADDGEYWDHDRYRSIDSSVNAHLPAFPARTFDVTSARFADLVREVDEIFAVGNEAGDPAVTTSPLVFETRAMPYYGDAINAAVRACHEAGGGTVLVPAGASLSPDGAYYTGAIQLLSGVNLHIAEGATVRFVRTRSHRFYPLVRTSYQGNELYSFSPLVYAFGQRDIALTGGGTLDGQEDMWNWRPWKKGYWGEPCVEDSAIDAEFGQNGVLMDMNLRGVPVEERLFTDDGSLPESIPVLVDGIVRDVAPPAGARALPSTFRPSFVQPFECENVLIEGIHIVNVPFWIVHPVECRNVLIREISIDSDKTKDFEAEGWNNDDGIDPESCANVVIERCDVVVSDDGIAIKAGRDRDGRELRSPTDGVIVRDCRFGNDGGNSAAVSIGSEMAASVRGVFVHDCTFGGPGQALGFKLKTNACRGGAIEDLYIRDCVLRHAELGLIQLEGDYGVTPKVAGTDVFDPVIRRVFLDNVSTSPEIPDGRTSFWIPSAASRSPISHIRHRRSQFHTSRPFEAGFATAPFLRDLRVEDLTYINPETGRRTSYTSRPPALAGELVARFGSEDLRVPLGPVESTGSEPTALPQGSFVLEGQVDLSSCAELVERGTVRIRLDRSVEDVPLTLWADGRFRTAAITLDDDRYWYQDRHYISVNMQCGPDVETAVFHVTHGDARRVSATGASHDRHDLSEMGR